MSTKKSGLGKNLSALLGTASTDLLEKPKEALLQLSVEKIHPGKYQPRADFDENALEELAASIRQQGLLQPLVVRKLANSQHYEIIAGERRFRACKMVKMPEVPVLVRQVDDETAMAMALIENLQRENLNAAEQAKAMARLVNDFDLTHQQVAELLGKSRTSVSNFLRLLSLSAVVLHMLETGDLDMGHARALLTLEHTQQENVAREVVARSLSVRETEQWVKRLQQQKDQALQKSSPHILPPHLQDKSKAIAKKWQAKVDLKGKKQGKSSLTLHFDTDKKLEALLNWLSK